MPNRSLALPAVAGAVTLTLAAAGQPGVPYRVVDLPVGTYAYPRACSDQGLFVSIGDRCVFVALGTRESGRELWVTDGTGAGTRPVTELDPRAGRGFPSPLLSSTAESAGYERAGVRRAVFVGFDEVSDLILDTDGTAAGTRMFRLPSWGHAHVLAAFGGRVAFWIQDEASSVWVLDGEDLRALTPPAGLPPSTIITPAAATATDLYFTLQNARPQLWRTDGTDAGTTPIGTDSSVTVDPFTALIVQDRLFVTSSRGNAATVWTLDPGAGVLRSLPAPLGSTFTSDRTGFAPVPDGSAVLVGTREGTLRLDLTDFSMSPFLTGVSVVPPPGGENTSLPRVIASPSGPRTLLPVVRTGNTRQLWATDGTPAGSGLLIDRRDLATLGTTAGRHYLTESTYGFGNASNVWVTDGTPAGTARLAEMDLQKYGNEVRFSCSAMAGDRLVVRPRTFRQEDRGLLDAFGPDGAMSAVDAGPGFTSVGGTSPQLAPGVMEGPCVFATGGTLSVTAGTAATTAAIRPGFRSVSLLGRSGDLTWFAVGLQSGESDLWRTDGTDAGTVRIAAMPEAVYRRVSPGGDGLLLSCAGLYTSDGTPGSLRLLAPAGDNGTPYADPSGRIYHTARSDFTLTLSTVDPAGHATTLATITYDIDNPRFTSIGPVTYLASGTIPRARRTLGSPQTTTTFAGGATLATPTIGAAHGRAIAALRQFGPATLIAEDPATGAVSTIRTFTLVDSIVTFGENAIFLADDGEHGLEPWITDGTPEGTRMIAETVPGPRGAAGGRYFTPSRPDTLFAGRDRCYFLVADDALSAHAWCTDGTAEGTRRLARMPDDPQRLPLDSLSIVETPAVVYFTGWTADRFGDFYAVRLCEADFSCDGILDFFDLEGFVDAFEAGTPDADFNGDGFLDFFDYDAFVGAFERGC